MNTQENNRLIAEFMSHKPKYILVNVDNYRGNHNLSDFPMSKEDCEYDLSHFSDRYGIAHINMEIQEVEPQYHTSWDELMDVIEDIDYIEYEHNLNGLCFQLNKINEALLTRQKEDTYKAVVEFIKYYNKNK